MNIETTIGKFITTAIILSIIFTIGMILEYIYKIIIEMTLLNISNSFTMKKRKEEKKLQK